MMIMMEENETGSRARRNARVGAWARVDVAPTAGGQNMKFKAC